MIETSATEFARNFARYREEAQHGPVAVTSHERIAGYFLSRRDFEEFERLKQLAGQSLWARELDEQTANAIAAARMAPQHDHLNSLMDE